MEFDSTIEELHARLICKFIEFPGLHFSHYRDLRGWLEIPWLCGSEQEGVHNPLIQELVTLCPQNSTSTVYYQLAHLAAAFLRTCSKKQQVQLLQFIGKNQDMRERLTTGFASLAIPQSTHSINAPGSMSFTKEEVPEAPKNQNSPALLLLLDTLSVKEFKL